MPLWSTVEVDEDRPPSQADPAPSLTVTLGKLLSLSEPWLSCSGGWGDGLTARTEMLSRAPGTQRSCQSLLPLLASYTLLVSFKAKISNAPHPKAHTQKASKTQKRGTVTLQLYSCSWAVHIPLPSAFSSTVGWIFFVSYSIAAY